MSLTPEQNALRARQGKGARYDAEAAPHDTLLLARRGTAFFARKLNELSDAELDGPSLRPGLPRRHIVAEISHQARDFADRFEALRKGETPPPPPRQAELAARLIRSLTLPDRALHGLFHHSEVHLNVVWRDLTDKDWDKPALLSAVPDATLRQTPMMRAQAVWNGALALNNGARPEHLPPEFRPG